MKRALIVVVFLFAGCSATQAPIPETAPVIEPAPAPMPLVVVPSGSLAPQAVIKDSAVSDAEARRYVAWGQSKPSNISKLTGLTLKASASVKGMKAARKHGHYDAVSVAKARAAVDDLRAFLRNKVD